jgi:O-antigen ligase
MSQAEGVYRARLPARPRLAEGLGVLVGAATLAALAVALSFVLYRYPPPYEVLFAVGIGLLATLALTIARYETAVALGFVLLAVVHVEPAPPDLVFAVVITVSLLTGGFNLRSTPTAITALIAVFLALNLLSAVEVVNGGRALMFFSITFYLVVFSLWVASYVTSARTARLVLYGYLAGAVLSALLASLALFVPFPGHDLFAHFGRARGLFKDPNVFGPFLVPAALILIEEILTPRLVRVGRLTKLLAFVALACGILFSYSRAAWLNAGVGVAVLVLVFAVRRGGGRRAASAFALLLVALATVTAAVAFTGSVKFLQERAQVQSYDAARFGGQLASIEAASRYPFGIGPGQIEEIADISTHSTYARVLGEQGVAGFVVILALMFVTLGAGAGNVLAGRDTYGIGSAALLAAWCGILANSLFIDTLHWRHLWAIAALIWVGSRRQHSVSRAR